MSKTLKEKKPKFNIDERIGSQIERGKWLKLQREKVDDMIDEYEAGLEKAYDNSSSGISMFPYEVDHSRRGIWFLRKFEGWLRKPDFGGTDDVATWWEIKIFREVQKELLDRGYATKHPITGERLGFNTFYYGINHYFGGVLMSCAHSWAYIWLLKDTNLDWKYLFGDILGDRVKKAAREVLNQLETETFKFDPEVGNAKLASDIYNLTKQQMDMVDVWMIMHSESPIFKLPRFGI